MSRVRTDLALRRLIDSLTSNQTSAISSAATSISKEMETTASGVVVDHANARQFIHGTGPYYLAKTSRGDQWPSWKDLKDIPADLQETDFDPENIEIDASQVTTGTLALARLPVAASGENSSTKLVRADDVRFGGTEGTVTFVVGEALDSGDYVTTYNDSGTIKLKPASSAFKTTRAIGFVLESHAIGASANVYGAGANEEAFIEVTANDTPLPVFLSTDGKITTDTTGLAFVMQVGVAIFPLSATRAHIETAFGPIIKRSS